MNVVDLLMEILENGGFGASPARTSVWCSPAGGCFAHRKTALLKKHILFYYFQMSFDHHGPNLLLTRGTTIKTGILTPVEFWWVPTIPEMVVPESPHDRSCYKESSISVPSIITISDSDLYFNSTPCSSRCSPARICLAHGVFEFPGSMYVHIIHIWNAEK